MKSQSKIFAHKLVALFVAIVMIASTFTGALTAYAREERLKNYHDQNLAYNFMTWAETTDEQTAEALLDWADLYLDDLILSLNLNADFGVGYIKGDRLSVNLDVVVDKIQINGYLDSVDGVIDILTQVADILDKSLVGILGGDVPNLKLTPFKNYSYSSTEDIVSKCGKSFRANHTAKDIIMTLAQAIYINSNDNGGKNVIGQIFKGKLSLGSILQDNVLHGTLYSKLKEPLGMWDGYEQNLVYNIVANLIFTKTKWYTEDEVKQFTSYLQGNGGTEWNFDDQLFDKLTTELMQQINAEITYPTNLSHEAGIKDTSKTRYAEIQKYIENNGGSIANASRALGYDENLKYTTDGNVYLFQYGSDKLSIQKTDSVLEIGKAALALAWKTALKPTVGTLHVNYDVDRGHGANFDNVFYYWMRTNNKWNASNWKSNYSEANVKAWANATYNEYGAADADEFLGYVRNTFEYNRDVVEDEKDNWRDIDSTTLFGKLRYNPLADLYFNMPTGPINLYFMQTGVTNLNKFFDEEYSNYDNIISIINDALVAAVKDFFPQSANIDNGAAYPSLDKTNNSTDANTIATTLVDNALKVFTYAAKATDKNILNPFYAKNGGEIALTEGNFEEAMIPLLISCIQNIKLVEVIHPEKFDACKDAEGVAYVALEEYLSNVLPNKDYASLISKTDGYYNVSLTAIEIMARDAVGYLLSSIVPCRDKDGNEWDVYTAPLNNDTSIYTILNSVVCYYASMDKYSDGSGTGKGVASLLGAVDKNGNCLVTGSKTLWQNIDAIANRCLPIVGAVINGAEVDHKGGYEYLDTAAGKKLNSEDLIYNKIIKGVLDIGPNQGVTNILKLLITVFNSNAMNKGIDVMVYDDLLATTLNALFGARDGDQGYKVIIPYSSYYATDSESHCVNGMSTKAASPFDSLVQSNTLAYYSGGDNKENGIIGILWSNIYEFFGGNMSGGYSSQAMANGSWTGAMFAVEAVNNFIPSFVPQLTDHTFNAATISIPNASRSGVKKGDNIPGTNIVITNNARGLNRFWRDKNGVIHREDRYYIQVTDFAVAAMNGCDTSNFTLKKSDVVGQIVKPEGQIRIPLSGKYTDQTQLVKFTITYDVFTSTNGSTLVPLGSDAQNLEAECYLYLTSEKSWVDTFYDATGDDDIRYNNNNALLAANTTPTNTAGNTYINLFNKFIVSSSNPSEANTMGLPVTTGNNAQGINGLYSYPDADAVVYPVNFEDEDGNYFIEEDATTAGDVADNIGAIENLAYAKVDGNGNIIAPNRYDISINGGAYDTGAELEDYGTTQGYTEAEIASILNNNKDAEGNLPAYSKVDHISYTMDEIVASGYCYAVEKDAYGKIVRALVDPSVICLGELATPTTIIPDFDMVNSKVSASSTTTYVKWLKYAGTNNTKPGEYDINVAGYYDFENIVSGSTKVVVSNDSAANDLSSKYNKYLTEMTPFGPTDFDDYTSAKGSAIYDGLKNSFASAISTIAVPVTKENADSLVNKTETVADTFATTSTTGDLAYKPMTADGSNDKFYVKNGYYYVDAAFTMPVYTNAVLEASDVAGGKDAVGQAVELGDDGKYHVVNGIEYAHRWDESTYDAPYYMTLRTQATDDNGQKLYAQTRYQFIDSKGDKVDAGDNWIYKYAISVDRIIPNTAGVDNRGLYQQMMDGLDYWAEQARQHVKIDTAETMIVDGIINDFDALSNFDYTAASYEKLHMIKNAADKLVQRHEETIGEGDDAETNVYYTTSASSLEIKITKSMYDRYKGNLVKRDYEGRAIEEEIGCATGGYNYTQFNVTEATEETNAVVTGSASFTAKYGVYNADGVLVNAADVLYTTETWNNYVNALAHAIAVAKNGHDSNKDNDSISSTYGAKKELQLAENRLVPNTAMAVSGTVVAAANGAATEALDLAVATAEFYVADEKVGEVNADGSFSISIEKGTEAITVKGENIVERTVTLSGTTSIADVEIAVVAFDYNNDGIINTVDAALANENGLKNTSANQKAFKSIFRTGVNYSDFSLD